jgi:hypothetical protein
MKIVKMTKGGIMLRKKPARLRDWPTLTLWILIAWLNSAVRPRASSHLADRHHRAQAGRVDYDLHCRRPLGGELAAEFLGHDDGEVGLAVAHGLRDIGRRQHYLDVVVFQEAHQVGRVLGAAHRQLHRRPLDSGGIDTEHLLREPEQDAEQRGPDDRVDRGHGDAAAIAYVVNHLLGHDHPDARDRHCGAPQPTATR